MLSFLPGPLKAFITFTLVIINTVALCTPLLLLSLVKILIPVRVVNKALTQALIWIAETWVCINGGILALTQQVDIDVDMPDSLRYGGWYLVTCNHQSWVDIVVLQKVFWRKIPFLKFFLKQELIWVPVIGVAWWALDFPFMKRYSKEYLEKHPEKRGQDFESTRKACEKFRVKPVSIMNFLEGTRWTEKKHQKQNNNKGWQCPGSSF